MAASVAAALGDAGGVTSGGGAGAGSGGRVGRRGAGSATGSASGSQGDECLQAGPWAAQAAAASLRPLLRWARSGDLRASTGGLRQLQVDLACVGLVAGAVCGWGPARGAVWPLLDGVMSAAAEGRRGGAHEGEDEGEDEGEELLPRLVVQELVLGAVGEWASELDCAAPLVVDEQDEEEDEKEEKKGAVGVDE